MEWLLNIFSFAICSSLVVLILSLSETFLASSTVAPKVMFSLLLALSASGKYTIVDSKWINYAICAGIIFGIMYLVGRIPRINCSLNCLATSIVAFIGVVLILTVAESLLGKYFVVSESVYVFVRLFCTMYSVGMALETLGFTEDIRTDASLRVVLERLIASVIYGLAVCFIWLIPINGSWNVPLWLGITVFVLSVALTYLADLFLFKKLVGIIRGKKRDA